MENYEKLYKNSLENAKRLYEQGTITESLAYIFPELRGDEDERIRKEIVDFICWATDRGCITKEQREKSNSWLTWLEKQGEKNLVNMDLDELVIQLEETIGTSPHSRETIKDFFQKAVQKYMNCLKIANGEIGRLVEENYRLKEKRGEQNPTDEEMNTILRTEYEKGRADAIAEVQKSAWSEVDEEMLDTLIANYKFLSKEFRDKEHNFFVGMSLVKEDLDMIDWLKSIKDRVQPQPKQAWSEEDEKQARQIERIVHDDGCTQKLQKQIADWFKSLKDRVQPQPKQEWSEEDEEMANDLIEGCLSSEKAYHLAHTSKEIADWLKSLKDRMQGKED